jgi:hypothetical protein
MKHFSYMSCATALLLAFALPSLAQKPTITEIPFTTPFVISGGPANGACSFDVLVSPQEGKPNADKIIQFANKGIITGPLFVTLTNESTQKSVNLNISGPSVITFSGGNPIKQVLMGPTLSFGFPPNLTAAAGLPTTVALANGRTLTFDAEGNVVSLSFNGTSQDVCQMLD